MMKYLLVLALLGACVAQQNNGDLESIINQIFGTPNATQTTQNNLSNNNGGNTVLGPSTIVPPGISDFTNDTSCTTEKGEEGECVRYYLCNTNNSIITDGIGIIDIRVRDGPCPSYLDTCCLLPDKRAPDDPITPRPDYNGDKIDTNGDNNGNNGNNNGNNGNNNGNNENNNGNNGNNNGNNGNTGNVPVQRQGCGWRNPDGVGMRTKGDVNGEAKFGEFPWTVAILKIEPVNENDPDGQRLNVYVGGGSLIHPNVVLTAAHYVSAAKELRVRAGEWDTQTTKEIYPYQDRDVASMAIHKDFNKGNLFYDIALLFLSAPMEMAPNVGVACLPPPGERPLGGTRCFASGWGKDKFGKTGRYQVILKKVEVPVVDRKPCQDALRKTRLGRLFQLHSSFMCAGGEPGMDTCKGDGGSPLVCPIEYETERYVQSGIVAWGIGCGEDGTPGVYVDVANLRNWIDDKVKGKGYLISGYSYTV